MIIRQPARAAHRGQPRRRSRLLAVLLSAAVLVGGVNIAAYAANGKPLLLGRFNAEGRPAVVQNNGRGPAMDLRSRTGAPSLKVSSTKKVPKLNADKVDGRNGAALETRAWEFLLSQGDPIGPWQVSLSVPPGRYLASYNMFMSGAGTPTCEFRAPTGASLGGFAFSTPSPGAVPFRTVTSSTIIDTRSFDQPVSFVCQGSGSWELRDEEISKVSLVALNRVQTRARSVG